MENMGNGTARTWVHSSTPARVEEILAKACEVLVRDGYADFNLRKVAAEAGVRLATVQYHFADRETLLSAAITKAMDHWGDGFRHIVAKSGRSAEERLRELQALSLEFLETPSTSPLIVESFALAQHNDTIREIVQTRYFEYRTLISELLGEIRPNLPADTLMGFATVFTAQLEGLVLLLRQDDPNRPNEVMLRRALDSQFDAFVAALSAYRPAGRTAARVAKQSKPKRRTRER
jgi:AcrR family transcriptional regulator